MNIYLQWIDIILIVSIIILLAFGFFHLISVIVRGSDK
tara:strand:+ start:1038 stop:1151 length:114 start_codon:yes stop_codon:yes gene_type:complete